MKIVYRYIVLIFVFFISIEAAFKLKTYNDVDFYPQNRTTSEMKYNLLWEKQVKSINQGIIQSRLILIGDSFLDAEEYGGQESYIPYFKKLAKINDWEFYNFALAGTSINDHVNLLGKISNNPKNIYVFSIKIHDVLKLNQDNDSSLSSNQSSDNSSLKTKMISWLSKSEVIYLIKDLLHHVFMYWQNTPAPNTHLFNSLITPSNSKLKELVSFLNEFDQRSGKVIVLINYPFNFKYDLDRFENIKLYSYLNKANFSNLKLLHSPFIVNDGQSVDWRNVHPNSESMKRVFSYINNQISQEK